MTRPAIPAWAVPIGGALVLAASWGLVLRLLAPDAQGPARASAAWLPVFGAGVVLSACALRRRAAAVIGTFGAAVAATLCAGAPVLGAITSGLVATAAAALALSVAVAWRRLGGGAASAALGGIALPALLAGAIFVADPFIEWTGSTPRSRELAAWVLRVNPIAAATSTDRGLGVDWQTMPLLYDGAEPGRTGLSVIGQYYPTRPPSPLWWGACAGGFAALLLVAGGVRPARESG